MGLDLCPYLELAATREIIDRKNICFFSSVYKYLTRITRNLFARRSPDQLHIFAKVGCTKPGRDDSSHGALESGLSEL